ncbi:hypothetical protein ND16A_1734 [Thalassotalea sp. ND16A]|nr:hypothetical protein ND16A_1734 [Thalassotalea sp. ND16A]
MNETYASLDQIPSSQSHVLPYMMIEEKITQAEWSLPKEHIDAAGSVWSSIHDMSLWAQFLLRNGTTNEGNQLLSSASYNEMFTPQQLSSADDFYPTVALTKPNWMTYGLGWFQQDFQGRMIDFHTGSLSGLIALIGLDRANDKAVIVLANQDHAEMRHALLWQVMDQSLAPKDWNQLVFDLYQQQQQQFNAYIADLLKKQIKNTSPSVELQQYVGIYHNDKIGEVSIVKNADSNSLQLVFGSKEYRLLHWHYDAFYTDHPKQRVPFTVEFSLSFEGEIKNVAIFRQDFSKIGN